MVYAHPLMTNMLFRVLNRIQKLKFIIGHNIIVLELILKTLKHTLKELLTTTGTDGTKASRNVAMCRQKVGKKTANLNKHCGKQSRFKNIQKANSSAM